MSNSIRPMKPLSLAIAAALLALTVTATPALAGAPQTAPDQSQTPATSADTNPGDTPQNQATKLEGLVVQGVLRSQMRSIELKRTAPSIQDSISAENIDQLPDPSIADSLSRITGVQIEREAGVGSGVSVRGLPQVSSLINGELFMNANMITSPQPNFITNSSQLFSGADVVKSPTASMTNSGISGSINLHTRRPWDLKPGWTFAGSARTGHGDVTDKWQPELDGLMSYNADGRWGVLISAAYSDMTRETSNSGMDQNGVIINGENSQSATASDGFLGAFGNGVIPPEFHQLGGGNVDVNGNGNANDAFFGSQDFNIFQRAEENKGLNLSASTQADLGGGFTITGDAYYTHNTNYNRAVGYQLHSTNWQGATFIPVVSRPTGTMVTGEYNGGAWDQSQSLYTTQVYKKWLGEFDTWTENDVTKSMSRNFNLELKYDRGGAFTGSLRGVRASASQLAMNGYVQFTNTDGVQWPNDPPDAVPPGTYIYPAALGGNRVFNAGGIPSDAVAATVDMRGNALDVTLPEEMRNSLSSESNYVLKTVTSESDHETRGGMTIFRADGHYNFFDGIKLDFGLRNSIRSASNFGFQLNAPVYAGMGASDPNGCMAHYLAADVVLNGAGIDGACTAGNAQGYFRAGVMAGLNPDQLPDEIRNHMKQYSDLAGVRGVSIYNLDPKAMDDVYGFLNGLYPGQTRQNDPGNTWNVRLKETTTYLQMDFNGELGSVAYSGNIGARVIRTNLHVTQHITGDPGPYGLLSADGGTHPTDRTYTDVLPAANLALDFTRKLRLRLAYSKNMMPLDLGAWGGGLTLGYAIDTSQPGGPVFGVTGGSRNGNPELDPWRSTNYGASLEYYINDASMLSLAGFYYNVDSFIKYGSEKNCDLPDQDGVVRGRCVSISGPVQGEGSSIYGMEFDYRQGFTFLPGLLSHTGAEINYTYSPSDTGVKDMAGNSVPFQGNSVHSGNLILWYQDSRFQLRIAGNYRSKRAVSENYAGIEGLEMYQAPVVFVNASATYNITPDVQVFVQGMNLTNEHQRYYLVWPDQVAHTTRFERRYLVGVRANF